MPELKKQINYAVVCINEFSSFYKIPVKDAFLFLQKYKAIDFLKENYEIEHTLSFEEVINDLILVCKNNGGELK